MPAPDLTTTTVWYLLASEWMPPDDTDVAMHAPGGISVHGLDFAGNLLDVAIWSLCEEGVVEVEQVRPYEVERAGRGVMGGSSFVRLTLVDPTATKPGMEGGLLDAARDQSEERGAAGRVVNRLVNRMSGDDERGLRNAIRTLDIEGMTPWVRAAGYCLDEAAAAGLAKKGGRTLPKPVITDEDAVQELQPRLAESRRARRAYREREEELDNAILADCLQALYWSRHTPD